MRYEEQISKAIFHKRVVKLDIVEYSMIAMNNKNDKDTILLVNLKKFSLKRKQTLPKSQSSIHKKEEMTETPKGKFKREFQIFNIPPLQIGTSWS